MGLPSFGCCVCIHASLFVWFWHVSQNIVLSGGSTMFKDFHRRLQRDVKKIVDARVLASDTRLDGEVKVCILGFISWCSLPCIITLQWYKKAVLICFAPVTPCGSECSQPSYPEVCCLVWRFCACINTWIFCGMTLSSSCKHNDMPPFWFLIDDFSYL